MPIAYMIVAMWVSFVGGLVTHDIGDGIAKKHAQKPVAVVVVHNADKPARSAFDGVRP